MFFENLIYNSTCEVNASLNCLSIEIQEEFGISVARQSISEKYGETSVCFLKEILYQLSSSSNIAIEDGWFELFKAVRLKDSTKFTLPKEYAGKLPGFGGVSSKSAVCIQWEFDLKTGKVLDLNITAANRPDAKDALETKDKFNPGDLIIRDLGYFSTEVITDFIENGAYVISKLNSKSLIYELINESYELLDFDKLYKYMKKNGIKQLEKQVYMGTKTKLPVRIIIETVPKEIFDLRMRKSNKNNNQRGYKMTKEHKIRSMFNLMVTNISIEMMPKEAVMGLYHMRWQIELVFKIWKSTFGIHKTGKMKYHRWLSILYTKLILIVLYWRPIMEQRSYFYKQRGTLLSLDKCFKTLRSYTYKLRKAIKEGEKTLLQFDTWTRTIISTKHWLEKKKDKLSFEQIMYIDYCKSGIYVYI